MDVDTFRVLFASVDTPLVKGVLAGAVTAAVIASTTAFAPVGAVGATGWLVVYGVAAGSTLLELVERYGWSRDRSRQA